MLRLRLGMTETGTKLSLQELYQRHLIRAEGNCPGKGAPFVPDRAKIADPGLSGGTLRGMIAVFADKKAARRRSRLLEIFQVKHYFVFFT
jgi:hypothetical protein